MYLQFYMQKSVEKSPIHMFSRLLLESSNVTDLNTKSISLEKSIPFFIFIIADCINITPISHISLFRCFSQ